MQGTSAKRAVARVVIGALLLNALSPLSVLAQDKGYVSPAAQRQVQQLAQLNQKIEAAKAEKSRSPADRAAEHLKQAQDAAASLRADQRARAPQATGPGPQTRAVGPDLRIDVQRSASRLSAERRAEHTERLKRHLAGVREGQTAVRAEFEATGRHLRDKKLPNVILERHQIAVAQFEQRSAEFDRLSAAWSQDPSDASLAALDDFFQRYPAQRQAAPLDPKKLPWGSPKPTTREPAATKTAWFQQLWGQEQVKLAQASNVGPIQFQTPPEPGQSPTEADLAPTEDVLITDVVRAHAAELGNNPVAILRWMHNNVEWVPSWGSLQGSETTIVMRRGNAADIASATIALLRAANVPARYVVGTIEIDAERLTNWIGGAESVEAAIGLLQQGGIATVGVVSGGRITKVRMEHVWVRAYANWAPSRGAKQGAPSQHVNPVGPHNAWVDIDPSYKRYTFSTPLDIAAAVPLDAAAVRDAAAAGATIDATAGFVSGIQESTVLEQVRSYGQRVQAYLDSRPDLKLGDLVKQRTIVADTAEYLSGVLPNAALTAQVVNALPGSLRHAITLRLYSSSADRAGGGAALIYRISLPGLSYRRLGVTYAAATSADQQVIDAAVADGATSLPAYSINVRPVVMLDGATAMAGDPVRMGAAQYWSVEFEDPAGVNGGEVAFGNAAGDEIVFGVNANGVTPDIVFKRAAQTTTSTAQGNLEQAALLYWLEHDMFDQMAAHDGKVLTMRMPSVVQMAMPLSVRYFYGVARSGSYESISGDAKRVLTAVAGRDETARRQFLLMAGLQGSAIEGSVLDQVYGRPEETSLSTTQYLAIAMRQGLKLFSVTSANIGAVLPQLSVPQSVRDDLVNAVAAGYVGFVPERDIMHSGYTGIGYMLLDPQTGAGAYLIDGGRNGLDMPLCGQSAQARGIEIGVASLFSAETLAYALAPPSAVGLSAESLQASRQVLTQLFRTSAERIALRLGPRLVAAVVLAPAGGAIAVGLAVYASVTLVMTVYEAKLELAELGLQAKSRTEVDTLCFCKENPLDPQCQCRAIGAGRRSPMPPTPPASTWGPYERRVDWHHRCADNSTAQTSYPGEDVLVVSRNGLSANVDVFNHSTNLLCEVKTSFRDDPYSAFVLNRWRARVATQLETQRSIAESCGWSFCTIVNKPWLVQEMIRLGVPASSIRLEPSCASQAIAPNDPSEEPLPDLD